MSTVEEFPITAWRPTEYEALLAAGPSALEAIPGAVCICDHEGWLVAFNSEAAEVWRRVPALSEAKERFCGSHRLFLPEGTPLPHDLCPMAEAVRSGVETRNAQVVIERPDGSRRTALVNIRVLKDYRGSIQGAISCFQDITTHSVATDRSDVLATREGTAAKRMEARIRDSEQHMRDLLEALPAAVYTTDAAGRITFYNKAAVEMAGCTPLAGQQWCVTWRLYTPEGVRLPHDECPMAIALKEDRAVRGAEAVAERPDGTRIPFIPYPTPLHDANGRLIGAINMLVDISHRKEAENRQRVLIDELNHRVKNTLATVQSLAVQTMRHSASLEDFMGKFQVRLLAIARAHDLLTKRHWQNAPLGVLATEVLAPAAQTRVVIEGPPFDLSPRAALSLTMALSELATNATKYGALSSEHGTLSLLWDLRQEAEGTTLNLEWQERGGPRVTPPTRRGFGARLMERCIEGDLRGTFDLVFEPDGVCCRMTIPTANCVTHG